MTDLVHAVLATPPGVNVGMATAELGLASVATQAGVRIVPRRHPALLRRREALPDAADVVRRMDVGLGETVALESLPARDRGRLLYWGDFQHMRQYVEAVARADGGDLRRSLALLLAAGAEPAILSSAQTFGSTLLFNSAQDLAAGDYLSALSRLVDGCADAWLRDPISATMARRLSRGEHVRLGVDPALLAERPGRESGDGYVAVFLGRTEAAHPALLETATRLARHFETRCRWLDWGCVRAFPALADVKLRTRLGAATGPAPAALEVLHQLRRADAVATDSYHLALIAWGWGIPAVTVTASSDPAVPASVDGGRLWSWRDKRELAASQYGALELLLRPEEWTDVERLDRRIDHICERLGTGLVAQIEAVIASDVARTRGELLASWATLSDLTAFRRPSLRLLSGAGRTVRAAAVVAVHNELTHVDGLIRQLVLDGIDVVVIDHGSTDGSLERALSWQDRGVLWVERRQFDGVFRLRDQLRWKQEIYAQLDHEWVIHVDVDEWPQARRPGERLIDLLARADEAGATAVDFEEFTFVPDVALMPPADPREVFCSYYHFAPFAPRLMRAWRRDSGLSAVATGGHLHAGPNLRLHVEHGVLRHYPALSRDRAAEKYLSRRYAEDELALGWHANRIGLSADDFELRPSPALRRLSRWDSRAFDSSVPSRWHYWEPQWRQGRR